MMVECPTCNHKEEITWHLEGKGLKSIIISFECSKCLNEASIIVDLVQSGKQNKFDVKKNKPEYVS